jgi:hypothetical protein
MLERYNSHRLRVAVQFHQELTSVLPHGQLFLTATRASQPKHGLRPPAKTACSVLGNCIRSTAGAIRKIRTKLQSFLGIGTYDQNRTCQIETLT